MAVGKEKISILGLLKFVASLFIVWRHMCSVIPPHDYSYPFNSSHVFVEFFLFVTGYMTYRHFTKMNATNKNLGSRANEAPKYTFNKFKKLLHYIFLSIIILYGALIIFQEIGVGVAIKHSLVDLLFLTSQRMTENAALWYISALLIVYPLFCLLCQMRSRRLLTIIGLVIVPVYYLNSSLAYYGPESLIRTFVGLFGGILIAALADIFHEKINNRIHRLALLALGIISFAGSIVLIRSNIPTEIEINKDYILVFAGYILSFRFCFRGKPLPRESGADYSTISNVFRCQYIFCTCQ